MKIPAGIQGGQKLRLKGKGLPRREKPGDLFVRIRIAVPKQLSLEEKTLFESLAQVSDFKPRD
jgi:curved DNA-binding protein